MVYTALRLKNIVKRMLVVAPLKPLFATWPAELLKWNVPYNFAILHDDFRKLAKDAPEYERFIRGAKTKQDAYNLGSDIDLINFEGLDWLAKQVDIKKHYDILVIDESSKIKNSSTKRFRILKKMLNYFKRRHILTGTPAPNGLLDLFGQIYILDQGNALGKYVTHYRMAYFMPYGWNNYQWILQPGKAPEIYEKIKPLVLRLDAKKYLKLPKYVPIPREITLPPAARKLYDEFKAELIVELKGKVLTAANAGVVTQKLRQIANGGVYYEESDKSGTKIIRKELHVHDAKTEDLKDLVDEIQGKPLFVGYEFQHDLHRIRKAFPDWTYLDDMPGPAGIAKINKAWNAGQISGLVAQYSSAAHGLNLQEGPGFILYYYGMIWDLEVYEQFYKRICRQGQKESSVLAYHAIAKRTIDIRIMQRIREKDMSQQDLLNALKEDLGLR